VGWPTYTAALVIALLSILPFVGTLDNEFAFDDERVIVQNSIIKQLDHLPVLFTKGVWLSERAPVYRPIVLASFALNYALGGLDPSGYHVVNILLHTMVSLLLYGLARQLGFSPGACLVAGVLFAVHPLHTEAVTGIVGRAELLMALGVLLALKWHVQGEGFQLRYVIPTWVSFAIALLSKEQAMMFPALALLYDISFWKKERRWKEMIPHVAARYLGYLVILGGYLALRGVLFERALPSSRRGILFLDNPLAQLDWGSRYLTALKVAGKYLWLFVWPDKLSADYSYNAIRIASSLLDPAVPGSLIAWGGLLFVAIWSYFRGRRFAFFGIGFTVLMFLPVSNLLIVIGTIMGERLFYLPSAGLFLVIAAGFCS
jgi:hypothetical protein